jgi:hypothetical protein
MDGITPDELRELVELRGDEEVLWDEEEYDFEPHC